MPLIDVTIVRDVLAPPWTALAAKEVTHLSDSTWYLAGLEGGMSSGVPSVALRLDLPDGTAVVAETSLAAWIAATCALRGAFPEAFRGTPLGSPDHGHHRPL